MVRARGLELQHIGRYIEIDQGSTASTTGLVASTLGLRHEPMTSSNPETVLRPPEPMGQQETAGQSRNLPRRGDTGDLELKTGLRGSRALNVLLN